MKTLLRINCLTALIVAVLAAPAPAAHADPQTVISVPPIEIEGPDGQPMMFEAQVAFCRDHSTDPSKGFGFIEPDSGDGLSLEAVWGGIDELTGAVVVVFFDADFDPSAGDGDAFLTISPVLTTNSVPSVRVDIRGPAFKNGAPPPFVVPGTVEKWKSGAGVCAPVNLGELDARVFVSSSPEEMWPEPQDPLSPIVAVEASIKMNTRLEARGFLDKYLADGQTVHYDPIFGMVFETASGEPRVLTYSLDEARQGLFLRNEFDVLRATASTEEGESTVNPGCLLWNLVNGDTGQVVNVGEIDVREIKIKVKD